MSSNDQTDNNNSQPEDNTNRGRHLTNMQLSQQVNQLFNIVAKVQNDKKTFQQQLLAKIGQNINAAVSAGIQAMQQNNNTATQPGLRPNGPPVVQGINHMMKPPKPDKFDGETEKVDSFLEQLEYILEYYQVPAAERTRAGSKWLTVPAMNWYLF